MLTEDLVAGYIRNNGNNMKPAIPKMKANQEKQ